MNGNVTSAKKILMTLYLEVNIHDITIHILMLGVTSGPSKFCSVFKLDSSWSSMLSFSGGTF